MTRPRPQNLLRTAPWGLAGQGGVAKGAVEHTRVFPCVLGNATTTSKLRIALASAKTRTSLAVAVHPRLLVYVLAAADTSLVALLSACVWACIPPACLMQVYAPLLPKPIGGRRGIQIAPHAHASMATD